MIIYISMHDQSKCKCKCTPPTYANGTEAFTDTKEDYPKVPKKNIDTKLRPAQVFDNYSEGKQVGTNKSTHKRMSRKNAKKKEAAPAEKPTSF